jgi:hypothetical protein
MKIHGKENPKMPIKKIQRRFIIICFFLVLALGATFIATYATINDVKTVHQHQEMARAGDVRLVRQWMTIPYVSHVYHIPTTVLYSSLQLKDNPANRHSTLQTLAIQRKQSADSVITKVQEAILTYRKSHPFKPYTMSVSIRGEHQAI